MVNKRDKVCNGLPLWLKCKESACNAGDLGLIPASERFPGKGNGYPSRILAGEFHEQRSLAGYSPWGHKELDTTD